MAAFTEPTNFIPISGNKINPNATTNKIHIAASDIKGCCDGVPCVAQFHATVANSRLTLTILPILNGNTQTGEKVTITDGVGGVYSAPISGDAIAITFATLATYLDTSKELTIWVSLLTDAGECKGVLKTLLSALGASATFSQNYQCPLAKIVKSNIVDAGADITVTVTGLVIEDGANTAPVSWTVQYWAPGEVPGVDAATGTITNATNNPVTISNAANGEWIFLITTYLLVGNNCTETLNPANYLTYNSLQKAVHTQA